uniref:Probable ATP-dependent transporter ycf16 n=1 Tax=Compsopogon caeruleus TaxID=31354 RepID=A0A7S1XCE1_9RHOD|mmetsp:Transcript_16340/g.33248  ORF Transcript_16340/g.33248 Transcript_16340/m.33248 type:complete len:1072 (-) Transcript_16340:5596-8811(-)|eukprot:CAMPEP_0184679478 /NCGR_PEP_ID=MMETSP0312-20130426/2304_1 /TAXON_ID=31354 /ORGANISM="Compsopogon coeruleus, Strain SAG 36.94" /LENGTH=1071 /DNA_ID=CAMNT_0027128951 /DNA_START=266 /DNA_END=3481 /DNA_ORIENTATION=-
MVGFEIVEPTCAVPVADLKAKLDEVLKGALTKGVDLSNLADGFLEFAVDLGALNGSQLVETMKQCLEDSDKKKAGQRELVCIMVKKILEKWGPAPLPFIVELLRPCLVVCADKSGKSVQAAAETACTVIVDTMNDQGKKVKAIPILTSVLTNDQKHQTQATALQLITKVALDAPHEIGTCMPELVPYVAALLCDSRDNVAGGSKKAMETLCTSIDNTDVQPLIPALISALEKPAEVDECVQKLAATTFVQQVECNALAVIDPLLKRGFQSRNTATKRMCAKIIENMAKLVERPSDVAPFMPTLMPALERASDEISDPEARAVCANAKEVLDNKSKGVGMDPEVPKAQKDLVLAEFDKLLPRTSIAKEFYAMAMDYIAHECCALIDAQAMSPEEWKACVSPSLRPFVKSESVNEITTAMMKACEKFVTIQDVEEEEEDAEELCRCKFSLAYGSKVLLNNTDLRLKRGFRYGLLGPNECGKTTLMRSIANGQVEGFPSPDEVRTVFVEADILGELSHLSVVDYIFADERIRACGVPREDIHNVLGSVGFTEAMQTGGVTHLSGGWRMKLALARAMLQKADILLLDEPTNHLDVINVKWVEDYLNGLTNVTSIIVSHDSGLLERVCTHIIQIDALKLRLHKGNLTEFVKKVPAAKAYFELKSTKLKFRFPEPGILEGINSKGKAIIKMDDVRFTYPGAKRPQVAGVTIRCCLSSRVACIGPNGAGKSTIIKLLTGELEADAGSVWKHPNCRVGYIAQHAFAVVENHMDKTPNQYIQWRYKYGEDREALVKAAMKVSDNELKVMKQPIQHVWRSEDGLKEFKEKLVIDRLTGQRRVEKGTKNDFEYEVTFEGKPGSFTTWLRYEKLKTAGWEKAMKVVDEKAASRASGYNVPLTASNVEKHLEHLGLDREFGTHCRIGALSGGQKVKVVLAAALWNQPHIIILDEPTNYLDRESLGALADAIKSFEGGVVIISHNSEFTKAVCPETWVLTPATETEPAKLDLQGDAEWMKEAMKEKIEIKQIEEMVDAFGNTVKIAPTKKKALSRQEKKKLERKRAAQKANGEYYPGVNGSDDED